MPGRYGRDSRSAESITIPIAQSRSPDHIRAGRIGTFPPGVPSADDGLTSAQYLIQVSLCPNVIDDRADMPAGHGVLLRPDFGADLLPGLRAPKVSYRSPDSGLSNTCAEYVNLSQSIQMGAGGSMNRRLRGCRASAAALAVIGIGMLAACGGAGDADKSSTTTSSTSVSATPTDKGRPGGPNNFSPTPISPLAPTGNPGQIGTVPRP